MRTIKHTLSAVALACGATGALAQGIPVIGGQPGLSQVLLSICTASGKQEPQQPGGGSTGVIASDGLPTTDLAKGRQAMQQTICATTGKKEAAK